MKKTQNKNKFKIGAVAILIVAALLIVMNCCNFNAPKEVELKMSKDSLIVTDGNLIYYNSPDGDIMQFDPYTEKAEAYIEDAKVLSADGEKLLMSVEKTVVVFDQAEKSISTVYNVDTDQAQLYGTTLYYKDKNTGYIMKLEESSQEATPLFRTAVVKFELHGEEIYLAPLGKKMGIMASNLQGTSVTQYVIDKTIGDFTLADNGWLYYNEANDGYKVSAVNINDSLKTISKDIKSEKVCFCKGAFCRVEKGFLGKRTLVVNLDGLY